MRDIVFFDLETTGLNQKEDRVIQITLMKVDRRSMTIKDEFTTYINPEGRKSAKEAYDKHLIKDEDLLDKPTFKEVVPKILEFIKDCDLGGHNVMRFDIPFLMEEFHRARVLFTLEGVDIVDTIRIETYLNSRKLDDLYEKYTGSKLEGAHDSRNDVLATIAVLKGQLTSDRLFREYETLGEVTRGGRPLVDITERLRRDEQGYLVYNFGKHQNKRVIESDSTISYAQWLIGQDFPIDTKSLIMLELKKLGNNEE